MRKFGHVQRRNNGFMRQRMLKTELPGRRKRRRPLRSIQRLTGLNPIEGVVDRHSFGSRGVCNSNSDCYMTCSRPEGIFVNEWVMGEVDFCWSSLECFDH